MTAKKDNGIKLDVLCAGQACHDLVLMVDHHPARDEKTTASGFLECGGGPAANAAITAARLGCVSGFTGYLGNDHYGQIHLQDLKKNFVQTDFIVRGAAATPLSSILVKPDGSRTVINYREKHEAFLNYHLSWEHCRPQVILFDGHAAQASANLVELAKQRGSITVLDAGSIHAGTRWLVDKVHHLVVSEKFAYEYTGEIDPRKAASHLHEAAANVVITLGSEGLVWENKQSSGALSAYRIQAVDTTGAGDVFHGAYAAGLVKGKSGLDLLMYASAAGALSCQRMGGRTAIPDESEVDGFLRNRPRIEPFQYEKK